MPENRYSIGQKFNRLTVVRFLRKDKYSNTYVLCICDCGTECIKRLSGLRSKHCKSCGCLQSEQSAKNMKRNRLHGTHYASKTPEYKAWQSMKDRCLNQSNPSFCNYGGRGIKVCDRWLESFENFLADMGKRPSKKHQIDRINNDGDYEPGNCRWATVEVNTNNRRTSRLISCNGKTLSVSQWERESGIPRGTITRRLSMGWTIELALSVPAKLKKTTHS